VSLLVFGKIGMAELFRSTMEADVRKNGDQQNDFNRHWAHLMKYVYLVGLYEARVSLRNLMAQLEALVSVPTFVFSNPKVRF
jgi:hypothetical protein